MSWPDPSLRTPHPLCHPQPAHRVPKLRGQSARVLSGRPPIWVVEKVSVELLKHHPNRNPSSKFSKNGSVVAIPEMGVLQSPAHHPVALSFVTPPRESHSALRASSLTPALPHSIQKPFPAGGQPPPAPGPSPREESSCSPRCTGRLPQAASVPVSSLLGKRCVGVQFRVW